MWMGLHQVLYKYVIVNAQSMVCYWKYTISVILTLLRDLFPRFKIKIKIKILWELLPTNILALSNLPLTPRQNKNKNTIDSLTH
jgi:hypothetical protein